MKIKWLVGICFFAWVFIAQGVESSMKGKQLRFEWDYAQPPEDIAGFRLYEADVSGGPYKPIVDMPWSEVSENFNIVEFIEVEDGVTSTKYFVLTAYDMVGNESKYSNEVFAVIDFEGPGKPYTLRVTVVPITIE